eukprot:2123786-Pleurochrysis_carterae.AAC.1
MPPRPSPQRRMWCECRALVVGRRWLEQYDSSGQADTRSVRRKTRSRRPIGFRRIGQRANGGDNAKPAGARAAEQGQERRAEW